MGRKTKTRNEARHQHNKKTPKMNVDIEELLESNVISANDGSIRKQKGVKTEHHIQRTPIGKKILSLQQKRERAPIVSEIGEIDNGQLFGDVSVAAGNKLSVLVTKLDPDNKVVDLTINEELPQETVERDSFEPDNLNNRDGKSNATQGSKNMTDQKSFSFRLPRARNKTNKTPVKSPSSTSATVVVFKKERLQENDLQKNIDSEIRSEFAGSIEQLHSAVLSPNSVEEKLKSPNRTKYLLKQLESTLSSKLTEPSKESNRQSRYGRIQKQKENADYIPLDVAKFITKSSPKASKPIKVMSPVYIKEIFPAVEPAEGPELNSFHVEEKMTLDVAKLKTKSSPKTKKSIKVMSPVNIAKTIPVIESMKDPESCSVPVEEEMINSTNFVKNLSPKTSKSIEAMSTVHIEETVPAIEATERPELDSEHAEELLNAVSVEPLISSDYIEQLPVSFFEEQLPASLCIESQLPTLLNITDVPTTMEDIGASIEMLESITETIPHTCSSSEILGIDEIKIIGLDTSFGASQVSNVSLVESPTVGLMEDLPAIPLEKSSDGDSAKGSSIGHDLQSLNEEHKIGQLFWGALSGKSMHWPCMIWHDPKTGQIVQLKNKKQFVHVAFFADNGRHSWIAKSMLMPFEGLNQLKATAENESNLKRKLKEALRNRTIWMEAVRQAEDMLQYPVDFREQRFRTLVELEKSQPIRKRSKSISAGYHSNSFGESFDTSRKRRHRSPTPESPAFEPIVAKRIKLEQDDPDLLRNTISRYFQSMTDGSDLLETASGTSSECDDISEMVGFDRTAYNHLLNMSRMYVFDGQTEVDVDKKLQKYVQKICSLRIQQTSAVSKNAINGRMSNRLRSQALRNSFLKFEEELGIGQIRKEPSFSGISSGLGTIKTKKKPLTLEQAFIFKLEKNYLLKGVPRGFVCAVCCKPNDVSKCSKCHNHYHPGCLADQTQTIAEFEKAIESKTFVCLDCRERKPHVCFVCQDKDESLHDERKHRCTLSGCGKHYHIPCLRLFPQHKLTSTINSSTLFCSYHTCHTCVSDDPRSNVTTSKGQLIRCIKCPSSYHTDAKCIPAGSQILSTVALICPKHSLEQCSLNVNWCFLCCKGGSLICCETCPTAFHLDCLKFIPPEGKYICEECESGRMPLYNEVVWAKYSNFRFWPALTVPPPAIPDSVLRWQHEESDICILFFGSRDYGWINRRRIYLYQEGDSDSVSERKNAGIKARYNEALREARLVHELLQTKKATENADSTHDSFMPPMYVKIKNNKYIPPLKQPTYSKEAAEDNVCECSLSDVDPCGPDSNCLNRALMIECNPKSCPTGERCKNQCFEKKKYPSLSVKRILYKGWGLFAMEDIPAGMFVIEYVGEVINNAELARRVQQKKEQKDENWYFLTVDSELTIDAGPKGNLARFINHSCEPNCQTMLWNVNGAQSVGLFALTDVKAGEELTFNYNFESTGDEKKICHCGASKCSGFIGKKYRAPVVNEALNGNVKRPGKQGKVNKLKIKRRKSTPRGSTQAKEKRKLSAIQEGPPTLTLDKETLPEAPQIKEEILDESLKSEVNTEVVTT